MQGDLLVFYHSHIQMKVVIIFQLQSIQKRSQAFCVILGEYQGVRLSFFSIAAISIGRLIIFQVVISFFLFLAQKLDLQRENSHGAFSPFVRRAGRGLSCLQASQSQSELGDKKTSEREMEFNFAGFPGVLLFLSTKLLPSFLDRFCERSRLTIKRRVTKLNQDQCVRGKLQKVSHVCQKNIVKLQCENFDYIFRMISNLLRPNTYK